MDEDTQHLQLLSIFHYVVAGFAGLFALLPVIHLVIGLTMAAGGMGAAANEEDEAAMLLVGGLMSAFAGLFILLGLAFAACLLLVGRSLAARTRYTFCLVMAAVECIFMPLGTVLGIFTLLVLMRDSVKATFPDAPRPSVPPAPPPAPG